MKELSRCPVCGGNMELISEDSGGLAGYVSYYLICAECHMHSRYFDSEEDAINFWNKRVKNHRKMRSQQEIKDKLKELYEAEKSLSYRDNEIDADIAWDVSCLVSAKIKMLEWVLG